MAVTEYTTPFKREKKGICSYWLANQAANDCIPVWLKKGTMVLPDDKKTPLIMIGPGTGVAAFVSFIQELSGIDGPQLVLIYGSRDAEKDYYYGDEWKQIPNLKVITAFSRT